MSAGIVCRVAEERIKSCFRCNSPVYDFCSVAADKELWVLIEKRAGRHTTSRGWRNHDLLGVLKVHRGTIN